VLLRFGGRGFGDTNGLARAFAGAGVGAGALTAHREATAMADATVAIDRLEALQVRGNFAAKVTLEHPFVFGDDMEDLVELFFREILSPHVGIQACFFNELVGARGAYAVDITEGVRDFLFRGDFYTEETWHVGLG